MTFSLQVDALTASDISNGIGIRQAAESEVGLASASVRGATGWAVRGWCPYVRLKAAKLRSARRRSVAWPSARPGHLIKEEFVADSESGTVARDRARPAGQSQRFGLAAAFRPIVSGATWLAVIHMFAGLFVGVATFTIAATGAALGISLLPLFLFGIPVLVAVLWACDLMAHAERSRFSLMLGTDVPEPVRPPNRPTGWRRLSLTFLMRSSWRPFVYAVLRLPLSVVQVFVVTYIWATGIALLTLPAYNSALPGGAAHFGDIAFRGPLVLPLLAVAGLLVLLAAPWLTRALAALEAAVALSLLGPTRQARQAGLTARIGELESSRARVVDAAEAERRRIERDLHDGAQQRLVSLAMELGRAKARFASDPEGAQAIVDQAHEQAKAALAEIRNLVRGVHPPVLSDRGLDAALSGVAALCPVPVAVTVDVPARPRAAVEAIAYFVVAEALTNVAKHSSAKQADVTVRCAGDRLMVVISDDGIGGADPHGQGLSGLAARVAAVDGRLNVTSPTGGPTVIEVSLPCGS